MSILTVSIFILNIFIQHLPFIKSDPSCIIILYSTVFKTVFVAESFLCE